MTSVSGPVSGSVLLGAIYLPHCGLGVMWGGGGLCRQQVLPSSLVISLVVLPACVLSQGEKTQAPEGS